MTSATTAWRDATNAVKVRGQGVKKASTTRALRPLGANFVVVPEAEGPVVAA